MKRMNLILIGALALVSAGLGSSSVLASGSGSYPSPATASLDKSTVAPGGALTATFNGFCSATVNVGLSDGRNFEGVSSDSFGFTAPGTDGSYSLTATGLISCDPAKPTIQTLTFSASASAGFSVVTPTATTAPATTTPASTATTAPAATSTTTAVASGGPVVTTSTVAVVSEAPVAGATTTTAALAAPAGGALPTTGSDTNFTLKLALMLAAGGVILLVVARMRRQQRATLS